MEKQRAGKATGRRALLGNDREPTNVGKASRFSFMAEVGFFQVEEVLIPKIQSSPAKSLLELYAGVEGEEMKRYM